MHYAGTRQSISNANDVHVHVPVVLAQYDELKQNRVNPIEREREREQEKESGE